MVPTTQNDAERGAVDVMRQIKRDEGIKLADGRSAILSAVELPGGKFEVMLLTKDAAADEIRSAQCETEKVALLIFNEMRDQYHVPELTRAVQEVGRGSERGSGIRPRTRRHR